MSSRPAVKSMSAQRRAAISPRAHAVDQGEDEDRVGEVAVGGGEERAGLRRGPGDPEWSLLGGQRGQLGDVAGISSSRMARPRAELSVSRIIRSLGTESPPAARVSR
jgi:hypothetical protein